jgi:feruloyl esterase
MAGDFRLLNPSLAAIGLAALLSTCVQAQAPADPAAACTKLATLKLGGATVTSAVVVPEKTAMADVPLGPYTVRVMPAFCRVKLNDKPSLDSDIKTEVWMPLTGWDGRVRGLGNGGFAGRLDYESMAGAVKEGAVAVATDAGHTGDLGTFALGHPEKVKDFGWRAVHDMTVQAKAIARLFYGKSVAHSYFVACSDGGREALMEAQRFPNDYNGILAGAPAYNWTALVSSSGVNAARMESSAAAYLPAQKLPAIGAAVNAACDAKDGVSDGILNDPTQCGFNPATLACKGAETDSCLMPEQVTTLKEFYTAKKLKNGQIVFPGYSPGAEAAHDGWDTWQLGHTSIMDFFVNGYFSNFVYENPDWKLSSFDFDKAYAMANEKTAAALNATETNLKPFADLGGKLILYHGWNDTAIPALSTVVYYDGLVKTLGQKDAESAVRLYMVPGMLHCGGGPGATLFGEGGGARGDAQHDVLTALEGWVEGGAGPGDLIATKFVDDDWAKGVGMTRPVCVYPKVVTYVSGDPKVAASFACKAPK